MHKESTVCELFNRLSQEIPFSAKQMRVELRTSDDDDWAIAQARAWSLHAGHIVELLLKEALDIINEVKLLEKYREALGKGEEA